MRHQNEPYHKTMFKCDKCDRSFKSTQALNDHLKDVKHPAILSPTVFVRAGWSGYRSSAGTQLDGEDWSFCDKDCGWCGRCTESSVYGF